MSDPSPEALREEWRRLVHRVTEGKWDESFEAVSTLAVSRKHLEEYATLRAEVERLREAIRAASAARGERDESESLAGAERVSHA